MTTLHLADRVEFFDMVAAYARKGLMDWQSKSAKVQGSVRTDLKNLIEENAPITDAKFTKAKTGVDPGFSLLQAPMHAHKKNFHMAFFVPTIKALAKDELDVRFFFLLWKDVSSKGETIGFRFESAHAKTPHEYPHVQICRKFFSPSLQMTIPNLVPDSYPAIPMRAHSSYDFFFSMVAAIHGHSADPTKSPMLNVLNDSLQQASKTALIPTMGARIGAQFQGLIK